MVIFSNSTQVYCLYSYLWGYIVIQIMTEEKVVYEYTITTFYNNDRIFCFYRVYKF